jgi:hypothetical protein
MQLTVPQFLRRLTLTEMREDQFREAERLHLEHQAAGELHAGLAAIYKMRADRLRPHVEAHVPRLQQVGK